MFVYLNVFFEKRSLTNTHKEEKVLKKTEFRCFSLTISMAKSAKELLKKTKKQRTSSKKREKTRENIVCIMRMRETKE